MLFYEERQELMVVVVMMMKLLESVWFEFKHNLLHNWDFSSPHFYT